jgi:DNA-binding transcriptional ArsR family regulator
MSARMHLSGASGSQVPPDRGRLAAAADLLALLADPTRLALLRRLAQGDADVGTLTAACGASRTSVSQHLARLRLTGLVGTRKDGRRVVYTLRHPHLVPLIDQALSTASQPQIPAPGLATPGAGGVRR